MKVKFFLIILFCAGNKLANAQFTSFPTSSYIQTPMGNIPITGSTYLHIPYYFGSPGFRSPKMYTFNVTLKNDSILHFKSILDFSESKHFIAQTESNKYDVNYNPKKNKVLRKIYPNDTKEIEAEFDEYGFIGMPNDSCWLFRTNEDSIYTYAMFPESWDSYITFFRRRGDINPILPLTKDNVIDLVKDDKDLREEAEKAKEAKLIKVIRKFNKKYTR